MAKGGGVVVNNLAVTMEFMRTETCRRLLLVDELTRK